MEVANRNTEVEKVDLEGQKWAQAWKFVFGFVQLKVMRCAIELRLADAIENHGAPITLTELSSATKSSKPLLYRIMRYLVHQKIFKEEILQQPIQGVTGYVNTPFSRCLIATGDESLAPLVLFQSSPAMILPWSKLGALVSSNVTSPFEAVHNKTVWRYTEENRTEGDLLNSAMACDSRLVVPLIVKSCGDLFEGVGSVVDVGGGYGTALGIFLKAFPWLKGINYDLPHVVESSLKFDRIENVGGDMFDSVPKADVAFLKWVLHDWSDQECIKILKNCKAAVPKGTGKIIIVEAVISDTNDDCGELEEVRLMLDMAMMAHTSTGKERTSTDWDMVLKESGFINYHIRDIGELKSVIVAYND